MRALFMISILAIAVPDRPDPTPKETIPIMQQLPGEWKILSANIGGKPHAGLKPGDIFHFDSEKMTIRFAGNRQEIYFFTLDPTKSPAVFDFRFGSAKNGSQSLGILKIEGDVLSLCFDNAVRPKEFASNVNTGTQLWQMTRIR